MEDLTFLKNYSEKTQRSRYIIKSFWDFDIGDFNPLIISRYPVYSVSGTRLADWDKYIHDEELSLKLKIKAIKEHLELFDDQCIPYLDIFIGTPVISSAFGSEVEFFKDKDPWVKRPVIDDYKDIDKIDLPVLKDTGLTKVTIELIDYYRSETNSKIPISMPDIQGPLSVAIDLMGAEKLYLGLIDDPKRIHALFDLISETIVDFIRIILKMTDGEYIFDWTGVYGPRERSGIRISEDNIISISKDIYREFIEPYHKKIIDEINGGIIHWCGNGWNNFSNIINLDGITGIHNSSMGDTYLIKDQIKELNNLYKGKNKKIFYFNCLGLPCDRENISDLITDAAGYRGCLINTFVPIDDFGISYNYKSDNFGYEKFREPPIDILQEFIRQNNRKIH